MIYPAFEQNNPYNIVTTLLVHLRELDEPLFSSADNRSSLDIGKVCERDVEEFWEQLPELSDVEHMLSHGVSQEVETAVRQWRHYGSFPHVLLFLIRLDKAFDWEDILHSAPVERLENGFTALNSNMEETGLMLVPRVKSVCDDNAAEEGLPFERHWAGQWLSGMNASLKNIHYIETSALKAHDIQFSVCHRIVDSPVFRNRSYIRIAFSPLLRNPRLDVEYYEEENRRFFSVSDVPQTEEIRKREEAAFALACREKADVLIFPEMLGDRELVAPEADYSETLDTFAQKMEEGGFLAPHLVFSPTWWHDRRNELHVFDNTAARLYVQQKQFPYLSSHPENEQMCLEDLRETRREIQVLHIPGLGRICIPICKDALEPEYTDLMVRALEGTILLNPSYSSGRTMFDLIGLSDCAFGCYRFWFNACGVGRQEGPLPGYIGIVSCPQTGISKKHLVPACGGVCGKGPCLFLMDLVLKGKEKGRVQDIRHLHGAESGETSREPD